MQRINKILVTKETIANGGAEISDAKEGQI